LGVKAWNQVYIVYTLIMNPKILKKFFEGKASADEVHQILIWINSTDSRKELEELYEEFNESYELDAKSSEKIKKGILSKIRLGEPSIENHQSSKNFKEKKGNSSVNKKWIRIAVASVASCLLLFGIWNFENSRVDPSVDLSENTLTYLERNVGKGKKLTIKLEDGSEVKLNSESSIRFPEKFTNGKREVFLEGEAFFNVTPDPSRPFIVHTKSLQTRVLGTSFIVKEDVSNKEGTVAVLTGKVQVSIQDSLATSSSEKFYLEPMDAVSFDSFEYSLKKIRVNYDDVFSWKDNVISFRNASFKEITTKLEIWYGVEFAVSKDFLTKQDYTGKFEDQTLEEVLLGLSFIYDFDFEINKNQVSIFIKNGL
jgi:transmembrane sensor